MSTVKLLPCPTVLVGGCTESAAGTPSASTGIDTKPTAQSMVKKPVLIFFSLPSPRSSFAHGPGRQMLRDERQVQKVHYIVMIHVGAGIESRLSGALAIRRFHDRHVGAVHQAIAVDVTRYSRCGH